MKKAWEKPQLLVLTRGKPEEAVLLECKADVLPIGPNGVVITPCKHVEMCAYPATS